MTNASQPDVDLFRQRGFGRRIGFGSSPGLIVVDIIKAFTDAQRPLGADMASEIEMINKVVDACHEVGSPVIFTTAKYDATDLRDAGIWRLKQAGVATLAADTDGHKLDERLHVRPDDIILYKKYASCFFGTDLVSRLLAYDVDTLIITGCTTSGCVRATAVDCCQTGFRPMVVRECVGDRSQAAHDQSLFDLDAKYADVVSLEETISFLEKLKNGAVEP